MSAAGSILDRERLYWSREGKARDRQLRVFIDCDVVSALVEAFAGLAKEQDDPRRVYFIQAGENGPIKIGVSLDPPARLRSMQIGCPCELRLLGSIVGAWVAETVLHEAFNLERLRGEWFRPSPMFLEFVAVMLAVPSALEAA